ncbi:MAG: divergent polysaccharide deacetylase family protein [Pseudorhodoplanes sp.]
MDDLNTPLGKDEKPIPNSLPRKLLSARLAGWAVVGLLSLGVFGFVAWAALMHDPLGGEPTASAPITVVQTADSNPDKPSPDSPAQPAAPPAAANPPGTQTITIIDGSNGKRQEVLIPASGEAGKKSAADPKLLEPSRHGQIPRIAPDGSRPSLVYARKSGSERANPDGPQVAIVIGGLGVSASSTADALSKLPPTVTFAFTPYGNDLENLVARAREKGHEVLLQVPMEPHDYPDNDPGPQTLLSSLSGEQNVDRLHWLLSRMQGYVGIMNFMGSRFTAHDAALAPVLREVSRRGLIYVDDGSSPRSQAAQIAGANKLPFAKADVVIDAVPSPTEIDNALKRLESAARDRGVAVGFSSALPASIDRISKWAKAAQGRGIVLVPITKIAVKTGSS